MRTVNQFFVAPKTKPNPFVSVWKTDNTSAGSSGANQIRLPLGSSGTYNFKVEWGDGNSDRITAWNQPEVTHTYAIAGTYTVSISGTIQGWNFGAYSAETNKITNITQWGAIRFLPNVSGRFANCSNLNVTATDTPNLEGVTSLERFFQNCTNLVYNPTIENWDVSGVSNFNEMFRNTKSFSQDLDAWSMMSATSIAGIFRDSNYNGSVNGWNTSNITNMSNVFTTTSEFNQPLNNWDVSNVTSMAGIFYQAAKFNQNINNWDVSKITNMAGMFRQTGSFNQPLNNWDVSNVTIFGGNNNGMFFGASAFNQPLDGWDMSKATNLQDMFRNAPSFDQNIGMWNLSKVSNLTNFMLGKTAANFSAANLDAIYNGWSTLTFINSGLSISFGTAKYTAAGSAGRAILTGSPNNWTITDGGI